MAKTKRIGLIFRYNENWVAGAYYIMNLIYALKTLPDSQKPFLVILSTKEEDLDKIREIDYPYISYKNLSIGTVHYNFYERVINKVWRIFKGYNFIEKKFRANQIDYLFPVFYSIKLDEPLNEVETHKMIFWIPDFQDIYYPHFFTPEDLAQRQKVYQYLYESKHKIIFSSQGVQKDFFNMCPIVRDETYVVNFAVTHPATYKHLDISNLQKKFNITMPYFFSPNQFWKHKNHIVILKAIALLKQSNLNFQVVFTGKTHDYRNPNYYDELLSYIKENQLEEVVKILGFITREEQLCLMKNCIAVIQPSLFEGWSTVVEDAKAMNQFVILSDLKVHREQLNRNVVFFDPHSPEDLKSCIKNVLEKGEQKQEYDYNENIKTFANAFVAVVR